MFSGYEFPSQEVSWLRRDVLLFANSIGVPAADLHFLFVRQPNSYIQSGKPDNTFNRNYIPGLWCFQHTH